MLLEPELYNYFALTSAMKTHKKMLVQSLLTFFVKLEALFLIGGHLAELMFGIRQYLIFFGLFLIAYAQLYNNNTNC